MNIQVTGIYLVIFPLCLSSGLLIHETPAPTTRGHTSYAPSYTISTTSNPPPTISDYGDRIGDMQTSIEDPLSARIITRHHPRTSKPRRRQPPQHQQRHKPNNKDIYHDYRNYYNQYQPDMTYVGFKKNGRPSATPSPPVMIYRGPDRPLEPYVTRPPATKIQFKRRNKNYSPRSPNDLIRRSSAEVDHDYHRLLRRSYSIDEVGGDIRLTNGSNAPEVINKRRGRSSAPVETSAAEFELFQTGSDTNATLQSSASTSFLNEYNSKSGVFADITRLKELQDDSDYQHAGESDIIGDDASRRPTGLRGKPNYDIHSGGIFESDNARNDSNAETGNGTDSKLQHRSMNTRRRNERYDLDYDYFIPNPAPARSNRHGRKRNSGGNGGGGRSSSRDDDYYSGGSARGGDNSSPDSSRRHSQNLERYRDSFRVMDNFDGGFSVPRTRTQERHRGGSGHSTSGRNKMAAPIPVKARPQYGEEYDFEDYETTPKRSRSRSVDGTGSQRRRTNSGQEEVRQQRQYPEKISLNYDVRSNRRNVNSESMTRYVVRDDVPLNGVSGNRRIPSRSSSVNYKNQNDDNERIQNGGGRRVQNGDSDRIQNGGGSRVQNGGSERIQNGGDPIPIGYRIFRNAGSGGRTSSGSARTNVNEGGRSFSKQSISDESFQSRPSRPANRSPASSTRQRPSYKDNDYKNYDSADYDYPAQTFRRSEPRRVVTPSVSYDDVD